MANIKHILVIHPEGNTFNNPTLKALVDLLVERGVEVSIQYFPLAAPMPQTKSVTLLPKGYSSRRLHNIVDKRLCLMWLCHLLTWIDYSLSDKIKYDLIVGVDREGLIQAANLHDITGIPFVFFSFEILFGSETRKNFKSLEISAGTNLSSWYVQDSERAEHLVRENYLDQGKGHIVPVASSGVGQFTGTRLRDKLGIPPDKKVAMLMGSLPPWAMAKEIIQSTVSWPEEWVLIVHERYGRTKQLFSGSNLAPGIHYDPDRIWWSTESVDAVDEMGYLLDGVTAGLALYRPDYTSIFTGNNLKYIGLSSGKISTFLRYGIPVIVNEIGLYSREAVDHNFGLVIQDVAALAVALRKIDYANMRQNCLSYFKATLDFDLYSEQIWQDFCGVVALARQQSLHVTCPHNADTH